MKKRTRALQTEAVAEPRVSQTEAVILAALSTRELYGLEIVEEVQRRGGKISLGGLYTMLHRLETKGLVESRWGEADAERAGARRRYYELSALGQRVLQHARQMIGATLPRRVATSEA